MDLTIRKNNKANVECGKLTITLNELSVQECSNTTGSGNISSTQVPSTEVEEDEELRALAQLINIGSDTELNRPSQQTISSAPRGLDTPPINTSNQQSAVATPIPSQPDSSVSLNAGSRLVGAASMGNRVAGQSSSIPPNGGPPGGGGEECGVCTVCITVLPSCV